MPIKVSKDSFQNALEKLAELKRTSPNELNLRQIVDQSFSVLKRLRSRGFSWEEIASNLESAFEEEVKIKPKTLQYYYQQTANKKQRKTTASKSGSGKSQRDKDEIDDLSTKNIGTRDSCSERATKVRSTNPVPEASRSPSQHQSKATIIEASLPETLAISESVEVDQDGSANPTGSRAIGEHGAEDATPEEVFNLKEHLDSIEESDTIVASPKTSSQSDAMPSRADMPDENFVGWHNGQWIEPAFNFNRVRPKRNRTP